MKKMKGKIIRAPSKLLWTWRFQNRCAKCNKLINELEILCEFCKRKKRGQ